MFFFLFTNHLTVLGAGHAQLLILNIYLGKSIEISSWALPASRIFGAKRTISKMITQILYRLSYISWSLVTAIIFDMTKIQRPCTTLRVPSGNDLFVPTTVIIFSWFAFFPIKKRILYMQRVNLNQLRFEIFVKSLTKYIWFWLAEEWILSPGRLWIKYDTMNIW